MTPPWQTATTVSPGWRSTSVVIAVPARARKDVQLSPPGAKGVDAVTESRPVPVPPLVDGQAVGVAGAQLVELVVGLHGQVQRAGHVLRGLERPRERARVELVDVQFLLAQPLLQQAGLLAAAVGEAGVAPHAADDRGDVGDGLAVPDEPELGRVAHGPSLLSLVVGAGVSTG